MPDITARLAALIAADGPIPVERYMGEANAAYYAAADPLGAAGDFTTAPEVSQMFGELVGLCLADLWHRAGRPEQAIWVELGPGRGTLSRDALRAAAQAGWQPPVHLVETSPALRAAQRRLLPHATWHDDAATLPDAPMLSVANEFFDALPVRQRVRRGDGWHERTVAFRDGRFVPAPLDGPVIEASPAALAVMGVLAARLARHGGALLAIDYGHAASAPGDTLQAVSRHASTSPWEAPGTRDLTAHVDFAALGIAARQAGAETHGPVDQGQFLAALGLAARAAALARAAPARADEIAGQHRRLSHPDEMGRLFKVLGVTGGGWPAPAGL